MPIRIERFEDADALGGLSTGERVVRFLATNRDRAFTRREIADAVDAAPETVGTALTRLKARGLVRHRAPYWAFTDDVESSVDETSSRYGDVLDELADRGGGLAAEGDAPRTAGADGGSAPRSATAPDARPHRAAAEAFFDRVRSALGDDVTDLYLFGSVARDAERETSDVDVLAVVAVDAAYAAVDRRLLDIAYDVQLEYGVSIEVHTLAADEFEARRDRGEPFVRSVVEATDADG